MKKIILSIIAGSAAVLCSAYNEYFVCRVPEFKEAPVIDGKLSDKEWGKAARLPGFGNSTGILSYKKQDLYLAYDKDNLYVGFRTDIDWEAAYKPIPFDNLGIWSVDCLDIALIPDRTKKNDVVRLIVERAGGRADMKAKGQVKQPPQQWNPEWKSAGRLIAQSYMSAYTWEVEAAIPWKSLDIPSPEKGTIIPAQFLHCFGNIRKDLNGNPDRAVTWTPVLKGRDWINPHEFGLLHFCGDLPVFRADKEVVFGVKGSCTAPIKGELSGLLWEIGKSSQPLRTAKKIATNGMNIDWPEKVSADCDIHSMMYWRLNDEHGTVAAGRYTTTLTPIFKVQAEINHQEMSFIGMGNLAPLGLKGKHTVRIELKDTAGKVLGKTALNLKDKENYYEFKFNISGVKPGTELILNAQLLDAKGSVKNTFSTKKTVLKRSAWMDADELGKAVVPPPGWTTPEVKFRNGKIMITTGLNTYQFGKDSILPEQVFLRGEAFAAKAFRFHAETSSGVQILKSLQAPEIISRDARGASIRMKMSSSELEISADIRVEFDGMAWYNAIVKPLKPGVKLKKLSIVLPLDPAQLRYMRANNAMNVRELMYNTALIGRAKSKKQLPAPGVQFSFGFSDNGWNAGDIFHNFYWIGGEDRGVFFALPSSKNMSVAKKYSETVDSKEKFECEFFLIDNQVELKSVLDYEFGFFLTPTKTPFNRRKLRRAGAGYVGPIDKHAAIAGTTVDPKVFTGNASGKFFRNKRSLRPFAKDDVFTLLLPCWVLRAPQSGNPMPPKNEVEYIDKWIKENAGKYASQQMLWFDAFFTPIKPAETQKFLVEFESWPITRLPVESYGTYVCPVRTWQNFYLSGVKARIDQKISSFYLDLTFLKPCSNRFHGCGYIDRNGNVQGKIPLLEAREMFLRYQTIVKRNNPEGIIYLHGYSATPLALWVDVITSGEGWLTAPDYSTLTPEYYQSIFCATDQLGTVSNFFPGGILMHYIQAQKNKSTLAEMCGLSFIHGEALWNGTSAMMPGLRMVWEVLDEFGVDGAEWIPYWRNPDSPEDSPVKISLWKKNGKVLLVCFNTSYKQETIHLKGYSSIRDMLDGRRAYPSTIKIPARGFYLLNAVKAE